MHVLQLSNEGAQSAQGHLVSPTPRWFTTNGDDHHEYDHDDHDDHDDYDHNGDGNDKSTMKMTAVAKKSGATPGPEYHGQQFTFDISEGNVFHDEDNDDDNEDDDES